MNIRQEIREVVDCLGFLDPDCAYEFSRDTYRHGDNRSGRPKHSQINYWFTRKDGTSHIVISVGKDRNGKTVREAEVQYVDPRFDHECPARYPRHLRHVEEDLVGQGWSDRMIGFLAPHVPECVQEITWSYGPNQPPERCERSIHFPSEGADSHIERNLSAAKSIWVRQGGEWVNRSPVKP